MNSRFVAWFSVFRVEDDGQQETNEFRWSVTSDSSHQKRKYRAFLSIYRVITGVIITLPREAIVTMGVRSFPTIIVPKISRWPTNSSSASCQ